MGKVYVLAVEDSTLCKETKDWKDDNSTFNPEGALRNHESKYHQNPEGMT
jgi:hypothetical protein